MRNAYVHPNRRVDGFLYHLFGQVNLKQDIPTGWFTQDNNVFEFPVRKFSMPANLDKTNILNVQPIIFDLRTIARFIIDRIEVGYFLKSWFTSFAFHKLAIGTIQAPKHLLASTHIEKTKGIIIRFFIAPIAPHARLFIVIHGLATFIPSLASVIQSAIVKPTGYPQNFVKSFLLVFCGIKAIAIGSIHSKKVLPANDPVGVDATRVDRERIKQKDRKPYCINRLILTQKGGMRNPTFSL